MAPKNRNTSGTATPISTSSSAILQNPTTPKPTKSSSSAAATNPKSLQATIETLYNNYIEKSDQRTKLLDAFMAFLVIVGAVQFVYCVVAGNYPFNAFLSGFSATVGQFVLTASLRLQTNPENKKEFKLSPERAFLDFILGSLILHFFCINFVN